MITNIIKDLIKFEYNLKDKYDDNNVQENSGSYIYFRNPKYRFYAKKFSQIPSDEIQEIIKKLKFTLKEKIKIGIMLSNLATKICQQGEYYPRDKTSYTDENKFQEIYIKCMCYTRAKLQKLCPTKNEFPKTARKNLLSEGIADAIMLGKIPKCPSCNGGQLRYNLLKGTYFCPGFIEGGTKSVLGNNYIFCNKTFQTEEINRSKFFEDERQN